MEIFVCNSLSSDTMRPPSQVGPWVTDTEMYRERKRTEREKERERGRESEEKEKE